MASKTLGQLTVDLLMRIGAFKQGLTQAEREAAKSANAIKKEMREKAKAIDGFFKDIRKASLAAFAGITAGAALMGRQVMSSIDYMNKIGDAAMRAGMGTEEFSKLAYSAKFANVEMDQLSKAAAGFYERQQQVLLGGGEMVEIFKRLNIDALKPGTKTLTSYTDALLAFADRLKSSGGSQEVIALGVKAFGNEILELLPILMEGSEGLQQMMGDAEKFGAVVSDDAAQAATKFNENINKLKTSLNGVFHNLSNQLLPSLIQVSSQMLEWAKETENVDRVSAILATTINSVNVVVQIVRIAFNALTMVISGLTGIVYLLVEAVKSSIENLKTWARTVSSVFSAVSRMDFSGAWDAMKDGYDAVNNASEDFREKAASAWETFKEDFKRDSADMAAAVASIQAGIIDPRNNPLPGEGGKTPPRIPAVSGTTATAKGGGGKSGADELKKAYEDLIEQQRKRLFLLQHEGEMGELVYDLTHGKLKKLTQAQKDLLLAQERAILAAEKVKKAADAYKALTEEHEKRIFLLKYEGAAAELAYRLQLGDMKELTQAQKDLALAEESRILGLEAMKTINEEHERRAFLLKQEGATAELMYRLQLGDLKNLTQAQKDLILAEEERLLMLEKQKEDVDYAKDVTADMEHQLLLLGKTVEEQERLNLMRSLGTAIETEYGQKALETLENLQRTQKEIEAQIEIADEIRGAFGSFFQDVISGTKSFKDAFMDALDRINAKIMQMITDRLVEQLFGQMGTPLGGSAGGGFAGFFSSLFGGGRAVGGPVHPGKMYRVNERGTELLSIGDDDYLMMGRNAGKVTPAHKIASGGGGLSQVNNFTIQGKIDRRTEQQIAMHVGQRAQASQARNS